MEEFFIEARNMVFKVVLPIFFSFNIGWKKMWKHNAGHQKQKQQQPNKTTSGLMIADTYKNPQLQKK